MAALSRDVDTWAHKCAGSQAFPTNFDGTHTRCQDCGRKLILHRNGKVPNHNAPEERA